MAKDVIHYPLSDGYIHHWLIAGPVATPIDDVARFGNPPDRAKIVARFTSPEPGIEGEPVEYGDYRAGEVQDKWRYLRALHDHRIDLSGVHPAPVFLRAWAYAEINNPEEREVGFYLTTDGPSDLWINDVHVHRRNDDGDPARAAGRIPVRLTKGANRLLVRVEAAAAGECALGLALRLEGFRAKAGAEDSAVWIPTCAPGVPHRLKLETLFEDCSVRQDVFARKDEIVVHLPEGKAASTPFVIRMQLPNGRIYAEAKRDGTLKQSFQTMGYPFQSPEGTYQLRFMPLPEEFYERNFRITRLREFYASTNIYAAHPYADSAERRAECLKDASGRKDNLFAEIAKMERGAWKEVEEKVILSAVDGIRGRRMDSDILLCGLLGMVLRHAESGRLPVGVRDAVEKCALDFRYAEDEPGADFMDFHGESHRILFPACEILAGRLFPDRVFTNAGRLGTWHLEHGTGQALDWLRRSAAGGFEEWDSQPGFEEDVLALAALTSFAENEAIVELSALMLDKIFFTLAVNSFQGVFGSTHGRTESPQIKTGYREATSGISRLLWGTGIFNEHILGTVGLACSDYELPPIIAAVAADPPAEMWSRERHNDVNKVAYKTPDYMLCSAQNWNPGGRGGREHIWQATLSPMATVFSNHPASAYDGGGRSPDFWCGNAVLPRTAQWKDVLVAVYHLPDDDWMGYTHAYFPAHAFDEHAFHGGWAFGRAGDGYIALRAERGMDFITGGDSAFRELRSLGSPNVWVCQMGRAAQDVSFGKFVERVLALPVEFKGSDVEFTSLRGEKIRFGWEGEFEVDGKPQPLGGYKHYDNPYCECETGAPEMDIRYGADVLRLHFKE